jgi:hypothetical protein
LWHSHSTVRFEAERIANEADTSCNMSKCLRYQDECNSALKSVPMCKALGQTEKFIFFQQEMFAAS